MWYFISRLFVCVLGLDLLNVVQMASSTTQGLPSRRSQLIPQTPIGQPPHLRKIRERCSMPLPYHFSYRWLHVGLFLGVNHNQFPDK